MATAAQTQPTPTTTDPVLRWLERRGATNRANSQHSTGPRTEPGKQRSSLNALRHGLTARTAVLPTEDPEAYQRHIQQFLDEYQPATATETQLVHELANTAWRINRIPFLEAELLSQAPNPQTLVPQLATLGLHGSRLSRQFQKPSSSSAISRKSAAGSTKRPKSSYAINAKDFPGIPPSLLQNKMASFFQNSKSSATHNA